MCIMQLFVFCSAVVCVLGFDMVEDKIQTNEFDVRPGGQVGEFEKEWLGYKCKFTYQSQGGTKEQWMLSLAVNADSSQFSCSVERPSGESYLFFQTFRLEVTGGQVVEATAAGENQKPLNSNEYQLDKKKGVVSDVPGKYGNHLTSVSLFAVRTKEEL